MVVTDLKTARRHRSSRRHQPLRAIVKDEGGMYSVSTPIKHGPVDEATSLADLRLHMNALQLNQQMLMRDMAIMLERGTPFHGEVVPSRVPPMRKTGPTHIVPEKSKVAQAPDPIPATAVVGNQALALPSPEVLLLPAPKLAVVKAVDPPPVIKPTLTRVGQLPDNAANDDSIPTEVVAKLHDITDENPVELEDMAMQYGMDLIEASEILSREYSRREVHCYKLHDKTRDEVKLIRLLRQQGYDIRPKGMSIFYYHKSQDSLFSDWWNETEARMKYLTFRSEDTRARHQRLASDRAPYTKGEQAYQDRQRSKLKATLRKPTGEYQSTDAIATTLKGAGKPSVTSATQIKVAKSAIKAASDWFRRTDKEGNTINPLARALGIKPILRTAKLREKYESEFAGSDVEFNQKYPLLSTYRSKHNMLANLTKLDTIHVLRPHSPWRELDNMDCRSKMDAINKALVKRGVASPLEVVAYNGLVTSHYRNPDEVVVTPTKHVA